jgi:hypothetical protein
MIALRGAYLREVHVGIVMGGVNRQNPAELLNRLIVFFLVFELHRQTVMDKLAGVGSQQAKGGCQKAE